MAVGQPAADGPIRRRPWPQWLSRIQRPATRFRLWGWLPHVLVGALALPFIIGQNSWYEWGNSLWLLELQTAHVQAHGIPTFFIHAAGTYFYPQQLFYAGPAISVLAYPASVFGPWAVFAATAAGAFIAASAGISWTARNLGVAPRLALLPGVLFATTPYTVSNLYGRGDWAELLAVGALAVALGAATSLLTGRARSTPGVMAILALSVATIAGVHNLTLLFSALLAPLLAIALFPLLDARPSALVRRYVFVVAGAVLGLALVGIFLVPNVWLSGRTYTSHVSSGLLTQVTGFDKLTDVLNPLPGQPRGTTDSDVHTQTIVIALAWVLGASLLLAARRRLTRRSGIALALLVLSGAGVAALISHPKWWLHFPGTLQSIQFTFRLVSYLALLTVVAVAVLLSLPAIRRSRTAIIVLVLATVWQVGLAGYLALSAKARPPGITVNASTVSAATVPAAYQMFQQDSFRMFVAHPQVAPNAVAKVRPIGDSSPSHVHLYGSQPAGSYVATNVVESPLIRFTGDASVVGVTVNDLAIVHVNRSPWKATVTPVCAVCLGALSGGAPLPLLAGRVLTVLAALITVALAVAAVRAGRRRNHGTTTNA